jgi:cytochrome P450
MPDASDPAPRPVMPPRPARRLPLLPFLKAAATNSLAACDEELFDELFVARRYMHQRVFFVSDPDGIKRVLLDHVENYPRVARIRRLFEAELGTGSLASEGETWWRHRRVAAPTVDRRAIASEIPALIRLTEATADEVERGPPGKTFDIESLIAGLLIRLWNQVVTGGDPGAVGMLNALSKVPRKPRLADLAGVSPLLELLRLRDRRGRRRAEFDEPLQALIAERSAPGYAGPPDMIWRLLNMPDRKTGQTLPRAEVCDEAASLIAGGVSPTMRALTWVWYLLALDPQVETRLHAELDSVVRSGPLSSVHLPQLTYLRQVIEETMRLYPPIPAILRQAANDDMLCGHPVPRRSIVAALPWVVHRHRRLWSEPDRFDPENFSADRRAARHRFAYLPFAGGPRVCVGAGFAMTQMTIVVAVLARRFRFRLAAERPVVPVGHISLHPYGGLHVTAEPRADRAAARPISNAAPSAAPASVMPTTRAGMTGWPTLS